MIFKRLQKFAKTDDEILGLSFAYIGEKLQKMADKKVFRPAKISIVHYNILSSLSMQSPRSANSISPVVMGSSANFSAILSRMEKENLIVRKNISEDRREVFVEWTKKGEALFHTLRPQFQDLFTEEFQQIPNREKEKILQFLQNFLIK